MEWRLESQAERLVGHGRGSDSRTEPIAEVPPGVGPIFSSPSVEGSVVTSVTGPTGAGGAPSSPGPVMSRSSAPSCRLQYRMAVTVQASTDDTLSPPGTSPFAQPNYCSASCPG